MPPAIKEGISYKSMIVTATRQEAADVLTFTLEEINGNPITYLAGQFMTFIFEHRHKEERRSFSISSSPAEREPLTITVKRVDNGAYSRHMIDRVKPGDVLLTTGAAGLFTLPENISDYKQIFFFAAGIGITPVFSLIKTLLQTQQDTKAVLIYSNKRREEVVFYEALQALLKRYPERFKIAFLYSDAFDLGRARLNKELLPTLLKEYTAAEKHEMLFYTCGPFSYMRMVIWSLQEQGINDEQIKKENFDVSIPVRKTEPPDKTQHGVTIRMNGQKYILQSQYPDTILRAAKRNGIALPYSCEAGRCGSCVAMCTEGNIWHSVNEVLTDADIAKGMILTCVAYPVGGDVVIEI